jgi:alcohol dehydrogenase YqhD (iron-dependent ADH family)
MHNFEYCNPTRLVFGRGTIQRIGPMIASDGIHKVLLVAGGGSIRENGVYQAVMQSLTASGVTAVEEWGVQPNPQLGRARLLVQRARDEQVEAVLAVGGGSVIDMAKCVAAGVNTQDLWDLFDGKALVERALPVFAVLTMSSTGSEMDPVAFVTNEAEHRKCRLESPLLYPRASIVDPLVQTSLPWRQTINGAVSALSHVMATYLVGSFEETALALNEALMRTIIRMVDRLQADHGDYGARANLAWATTLAMNGVSSVGIEDGDWSACRIEAAISAMHPEVAHGAGLAVILPAWTAWMQEGNPGQFQRWARAVWNAGTVDEGVAAMKTALQHWGAPTALGDIGVTAGELRDVAFAALAEGPLGRLRTLTAREVVELLKGVL